MAEVKYEDIPTGHTYVCEIAGCERSESKNGKPMLKVTYKILEGRYKNRRIWQYQMADTETGITIANKLWAQCKALGGKQVVLSYYRNKKGYTGYKIIGCFEPVAGDADVA